MQLKTLLVQSVFWRGLYFLTVLLLNVLVARFFKASGSGIIYYVSSFYAFVIVIISLSLESGMGFYASRNEVSVKRLLSLSVLWTLIVAVGVCSATWWYLRSGAGLPLPREVLLMSSLSYICGNLLTNYCNTIFYSKKNFYTPNIVGITCNLLLIAILLAGNLGLVHAINDTLFLYIYFLTFPVQGVLLIFALMNAYPMKEASIIVSKTEFKKILRYSMMAFAGNIIFFLVYRVDYFFVKYYCSAADLGNYIQVSKLGQMVILLPSIMASAVFPMVAGGQGEEVNRGLKLLSRISLIVIGALCLVVASMGGHIFPFLFGKSFDKMYFPFLLLIPGILSLSSLFPLSAYYSGKNKIWVNLQGSLIALVFIVIADFIFIPHYGINVAALISSVGYIIFHAYVLFIFSKEYKTNITGFFLIRRSDFQWIKKFILKPLA